MVALGFDNRTGGVAVVVGYGLFFVVLFRNPADGLATATATIQAFLFFVLFPALGLGGGVYTYLDWPMRTSVAFVSGSYLGVVGIAFAVLPTANQIVTTFFGLCLFGLAVLGLVAPLSSSMAQLFPGESFR